MKQFLKEIKNKLLPPPIWWHGDFASWKEAADLCSGYAKNNILEAVIFQTREIREKPSLNLRFPLMSILQLVKADLKRPLDIYDFGGALGTLYFEHRNLFEHFHIKINSWCVSEQKHYVQEGKRLFADEIIKYQEEPPQKYDLLILCSVIHYLEKPYEMFAKLLETRPKCIYIEKTFFNSSDSDRLCIQTVRPPIYDASYPCWFLSEKKLRSIWEKEYQVLAEYCPGDTANIPSLIKGFLLKLKS